MKKLLAFLPHLAICFVLALLVVVILDRVNPMIGFLRGAPFVVLMGCTVLSVLGSLGALVLRRH